MSVQIGNREKVLASLRRELVGPAPAGKELNLSAPIHFETRPDSYGPWREQGTGEEVLTGDRPCKRYGVGVLYPMRVPDEELAVSQEPGPSGVDLEGGRTGEGVTEEAQECLEKMANRSGANQGIEDLDLSGANKYRPSSMAVTFVAELHPGAVVTVEFSGGRYRPFRASVEGSIRTWWVRSPVVGSASFTATDLIAATGRVLSRPIPAAPAGGPDIRVEALCRPLTGEPFRSRLYLVTVCLVNRSNEQDARDEACLFQAAFAVSVRDEAGGSELIAPYPAAPNELKDKEEDEIAMLYRDAPMFAVGHGCAADWSSRRPGMQRVSWVRAECLPVLETTSITPDIERPDGTRLEVRMAPLAGLEQGDDGFASLEEVIALYVRWIEEREAQAASLGDHGPAAARHIKRCREAHARMIRGLEYLRADPTALAAFRLANHAMLLQQVRTSNRRVRRREYDKKLKRFTFSESFEPVVLPPASAPRGKWRPFQIAFLLQSLESTGNPDSLDRDIVELIWFPTGGGKTEAYLGLTAFGIFLRRMKALKQQQVHEDAGVHVLMRYTLRLLTSQQFQRATALICAMEYLRAKRRSELGEKRFSIGLWVGGTPNKRESARKALRVLQRDGKTAEDNILVLEKCPWCRADLGVGKSKVGQSYPVHGYESRPSPGGQETVVARCPDPACDFHQRLPVEFIDEDIYDRSVNAQPVSLLIGTVDKFAMLAYRPEARAIFGRGTEGTQEVSPPGLILQDELHLISGPLGSMVGLYETVVQELCTDRRGKGQVLPKIVTSTATIRRYREQVRDVFARKRVGLFPPPGLDASDSFFARVAREPDGRLRRGRLYVGVHAPALGSSQTAQVRTFSALQQAPLAIPKDERDPWWTLLIFYNSLRELGGALTLFHSDIPGYLEALRRREEKLEEGSRRPRHLVELTGRLANDEVNSALSSLEIEVNGADKPVDACLASNIIEVGVDIDRLSLMAVTGQPKTTAQYIQVTGRVGRRWWERPGLVVTIYSASKPRDRSHFEKFRTYHERLYAQVEPTSVTPFSYPALKRALHAVMAIYVRQTGSLRELDTPAEVPFKLLERLRDIAMERAKVVDPAEVPTVNTLFTERIEEWERWKPSLWNSWVPVENPPLLRWPGKYVPRGFEDRSWSTPSSMRSVDAECQVEITHLFEEAQGSVEAGGEWTDD
ncbi:helicase [Corallococcus exiguus]|uniref:helicase-related protein n=1 Tax=Corallococcus exiguus TaxID=83462 RepID=UPI001473CFF0|nr:helicase-related protein [Corallococcus exiguus]NNB93704.1 helicase [Corallococcus exiguus]